MGVFFMCFNMGVLLWVFIYAPKSDLFKYLLMCVYYGCLLWVFKYFDFIFL